MSSISLSTALSGISAANERLRASASNMASLATGTIQREQASAVRAAPVATQAAIDPATEAVEQQSATYAFVANLRVLQTQVRAEGSLLDIHA